jgi:hypothetical protein
MCKVNLYIVHIVNQSVLGCFYSSQPIMLLYYLPILAAATFGRAISDNDPSPLI